MGAVFPFLSTDGKLARVPDVTRPFIPSWLLLLLWLLTLPMLCAGLGEPVVKRTQEARVLETAREMYTSNDWRNWMIPVLNGQVRMKKPPLAYWVAAGMFRWMGVNELAGRLPFAVAGWLTIALVYRFGRDLFNPRFGFLAAAMLLTSFLFFRSFRLAETDSLAAVFVTASIYGFWGATRAGRRGAFVRFHLGALFAAMAVLAKGGPAVFPFLFLVALAIVERNGAILYRFLLSGAPITFAVIGGTWYVYAYFSAYAHVLGSELGVIAIGEDHGGWFWDYFPAIFTGAGPWTGLLILGLIGAVRRWRQEARSRTLLIYAAVIFLPLCLIGNKQPHYLVPLAPALAMLCAFAVERGALGENERDAAAVRAVFWITVAVTFAAPAAVLYVARKQHGGFDTTDLALATIVLMTLVATVSTGKRQGIVAAVCVYAAGLALGMAVTFGRWLPSLDPVTHRTIAAQLHDSFGPGPYVFYGENISLPLVWNLRTIVPQCRTEAELRAALADDPQTVVIAQTKNKTQPPPVPAPLSKMGDLVEEKGSVFSIYADAP
jgi:4-amino-4-deoxy-L-arabinose transferase-like glycosyltransferase